MAPEQFERIAKALADSRRFAIFEAIAATDELACKALVARLPIVQATVSHHVKELNRAGLIDIRREGQGSYLKARPLVLEEYLQQVRTRLVRSRSRH
jgi:ArsR family transcriptional regulator